MSNELSTKLLKNKSIFKYTKYSNKMEEKGYFESLRKKAKATTNQQLIGYTSKRGFFGRIKESPFLIDENNLENGALISGSCGSGISLCKNILLYNQLKKGMGGLILPSLDPHSELYQLAKMMNDTERKDIVLINGLDNTENKAVWDFFKNGTTEEIITYFTLYLENIYDQSVVEKVKPIIKSFFEYYQNKKIELNSANIHEYLDFYQKYKDINFYNYSQENFPTDLDKELIESINNYDNKEKILNTAKALLRDALEEIMIFCNNFMFSESDMDFKKHIIDNKVIYAFGACNYRYPIHGRIFNILIMDRYLKTLDEVNQEYNLKEKSHFLLYSSDEHRKNENEIKLIESAINNKNLYTVYVSRDLSGECTNKKLIEIIKSFKTKFIMKEYDPEEIVKLAISELNTDKIVNIRDLVDQNPGEAHMFIGDTFYRIKFAFFSSEEIKDLSVFLSNSKSAN